MVKQFQNVLLGNSCKIHVLENAHHQFHLQPRPGVIGSCLWQALELNALAGRLCPYLRPLCTLFCYFMIDRVFSQSSVRFYVLIESKEFLFLITIKYNATTKDPNLNHLQLAGKSLYIPRLQLFILKREPRSRSGTQAAFFITVGQASNQPSEWSLLVSSKSLCTQDYHQFSLPEVLLINVRAVGQQQSSIH